MNTIEANAMSSVRGVSRFGDRAFQWLTLLMALSIFVLIALIGIELFLRRMLAACGAPKIRLAFPDEQHVGPGK